MVVINDRMVMATTRLQLTVQVAKQTKRTSCKGNSPGWTYCIPKFAAVDIVANLRNCRSVAGGSAVNIGG